MRTTINIDDELLAKAIAYTGIEEKARLMNYVLERFVKNEAARRLRKLAGSMPDLDMPARRDRAGASGGEARLVVAETAE